MIQVNAVGDPCPIPVVKTKNAIRELGGPGVVETTVDNEIAVRNLQKMARQLGCESRAEKTGENRFLVTVTVTETAQTPAPAAEESCLVQPGREKNTVVVIASDQMGEGSPELGKTLMKGFLYALGQQDTLPRTILFYNGGAALSCEGSPALEDLKSLEAQGVEILTCGTCLNFYGLSEKLRVGEVTNMYSIVEKMTQADCVVKP